MKKFSLTGRISPEGELKFDRKYFANAVTALGAGVVTITVEKVGKRTIAQNRYFHGPVIDCFLQCFKNLGIDFYETEIAGRRYKTPVGPALIKDFLVANCMPEKVNKTTGEAYTPGTSELGVQEFSDFIQKIAEFGFDRFGIQLPEPNFGE